MKAARGIFRLTATVLLFLFYTPLILLVSWIPTRIRGSRPANWLAVYLSRAVLRIFNIKVTYHHLHEIDTLNGFIFPNHVSIFDIFVIASIAPVRFLSKMEIYSWPLAGWIARAIETVFVDRSDRESRSDARSVLMSTPLTPPLVLFPEGGITPPAEKIKPFRFGAFEIAAQRSATYVPCVLHYEPLELAFWEDDELLPEIWASATAKEALLVDVFFLSPVAPRPDQDPQQLALEAHGMMSGILQYGNRPDSIIQDGL